jgi:hypothetical protein
VDKKVDFSMARTNCAQTVDFSMAGLGCAHALIGCDQMKVDFSKKSEVVTQFCQKQS